MDSQFVSPPSFPVPEPRFCVGQRFTIDFAETNTVYYTLDGTGPQGRRGRHGNDIAQGPPQYWTHHGETPMPIVARARNPQHGADGSE